MERRNVPVIHVGGLDTEDDPILSIIAEGIRQSMNAGDGPAMSDWMDAMHELQETRAIACVAAAWN